MEAVAEAWGTSRVPPAESQATGLRGPPVSCQKAAQALVNGVGQDPGLQFSRSSVPRLPRPTLPQLQVDPTVLPAPACLQAFLPPRCRGARKEEVPLDKGAHPGGGSEAASLPALDVTPPAQQLQAGCEDCSCAGAVPPSAWDLLLIGPHKCQSPQVGGGGAYANRKWAGGHWLTGQPPEVRQLVRPPAGARVGPGETGPLAWFLSRPLPLP